MAASRTPKRRSRPPADQYQLALPLAWLTEPEFIEALRVRGVGGVRRVRYRPNRSSLISVSSDHTALNLHECFRGATDPVLDAIALFINARHGTLEQRHAVRLMRAWSDGQWPADFMPAPRRAAASAGTREQLAFLGAAYRHLNRERFYGRLPEEIPIRLSQRMQRRFGHVEYRRGKGARAIVEIGLNIDLLLQGNERPLLDTLLHEMAHVEAWLVYGHRGHGEEWERIAERVGCEVHASSHMRIRRRRAGLDTAWVPNLDAFLAAARGFARTRRPAKTY
jgi:hypothetical protein